MKRTDGSTDNLSGQADGDNAKPKGTSIFARSGGALGNVIVCGISVVAAGIVGTFFAPAPLVLVATAAIAAASTGCVWLVDKFTFSVRGEETKSERRSMMALGVILPIIGGVTSAKLIDPMMSTNQKQSDTHISVEPESRTDIVSSPVELRCDLTPIQKQNLSASFSQTNPSVVRDVRVMDALRQNCKIWTKLVP